MQDALAFTRNIVFVSGKGGVGKTVVSQSLALALSKTKRVLWIAFEDPLKSPGELNRLGPNLWHLNCESSRAFEEYVTMKFSVPLLTKIFLQNKLIKYLAKAAPGIHELVLIGKVWHERLNYDHVIVDMPSTGYGLAMFQSTQNFATLFRGGPINRDAEQMLETFRNPQVCGQLIVSLPEEMPLRESMELSDVLLGLFPKNQASFIVNRKFPRISQTELCKIVSPQADPEAWSSPVPASALDYVCKRSQLEEFNLKLWENEKIHYAELPYLNPSDAGTSHLVSQLADQFYARGYL